MDTFIRITLSRIVLIDLSMVIIGYLNKCILYNNVFFVMISCLLMGRICCAIDQRVLRFNKKI